MVAKRAEVLAEGSVTMQRMVQEVRMCKAEGTPQKQEHLARYAGKELGVHGDHRREDLAWWGGGGSDVHQR